VTILATVDGGTASVPQWSRDPRVAVTRAGLAHPRLGDTAAMEPRPEGRGDVTREENARRGLSAPQWSRDPRVAVTCGPGGASRGTPEPQWSRDPRVAVTVETAVDGISTAMPQWSRDPRVAVTRW